MDENKNMIPSEAEISQAAEKIAALSGQESIYASIFLKGIMVERARQELAENQKIA